MLSSLPALILMTKQSLCFRVTEKSGRLINMQQNIDGLQRGTAELLHLLDMTACLTFALYGHKNLQMLVWSHFKSLRYCWRIGFWVARIRSLCLITHSRRGEAKSEGAASVPSISPTPGWRDLNDGAAAMGILMAVSQRKPFCPCDPPPSNISCPPPPSSSSPNTTHQCAETEALVHGEFTTLASRLQSSLCIHLSSPKMIPSWGARNIISGITAVLLRGRWVDIVFFFSSSTLALATTLCCRISSVFFLIY